MAEKIKIVPLGGLGEVGKNMMAIEYGRNILMVDAGIMFPEFDMLGVDYIIPDWDYLRDKKDILRAMVITHGHEDHIGALPHFLREFNVPVYATRLTRGLIEVKLKPKKDFEDVELITYAPGDEISIGPFKIEPYHVCHSIPDVVGLGITTPAGLIVHSADFKFDHTPVDGWPTDYAKLSEFGGRGVLVLLSDSTNAVQPGHTPSEAALNGALNRVMQNAPGRVIVATFASLISRIQQVIDVAAENDRKVAIAGRTMVENVKMARQLGYLNVSDKMLLSLGEIKKHPPSKTVIIATGSQGEPRAVLGRLSMGRHASLHIQDKDTVVFSSHTIPGNEEMTHRVINRLVQKGADVYYGEAAQVHVSGHASQEEQKMLISILRPKYFVPIHGELRHLHEHGKLARQVGVPQDHIAVVENGYPLTFDEKEMHIGERIPGGYVFVDGARVGEIGPELMRERSNLGQNGFVIVTAHYQKAKGHLAGQPQLVTRGFVLRSSGEALMSRAQDVVRSAANVESGTPVDEVETKIEKSLSRFLYQETKSRPVVIAQLLAL